MKPRVRFTRHAMAKFSILAAHGFPITQEQVLETLASPARIEDHTDELIAQKRISPTHVLRVVYRLEGGELVVITFYPGRRTRYEDTL